MKESTDLEVGDSIIKERDARIVKIKRIGVLSLGYTLGILYAGMVLIFTVFQNFYYLIIGLTSQSRIDYVGMLRRIIVLPLFGVIFGFIIGLVVAFLYNLIARWGVGIEVETE